MYVAIVQINTLVVDNETAKEIGMNSAEMYASAKEAGLLMKYYLSGEAGCGGVYVWKTKADAESWFTPEWYGYMKENFAEPTVTFYHSFVQVDNIIDQIVVDGRPQ
jgi:hypothetical protein